jgi:hypothetical protein
VCHLKKSANTNYYIAVTKVREIFSVKKRAKQKFDVNEKV